MVRQKKTYLVRSSIKQFRLRTNSFPFSFLFELTTAVYARFAFNKEGKMRGE